MSWLQIKKLPFWSVIFFYSMQQQWTISRSSCDVCWKVDFIYNNRWWPAQLLDWEEAPKSFQKPNPHQRQGHGHYLVVCFRFRNACETIISEKYMKYTSGWWNRPKTAMPAAGISWQKGPNSSPQQLTTTCCTINTSKVGWIGLQSFVSSTIFICESVSHSVLSDCDPINCSTPGSSVHGILQERILKWLAIPFSRGSSWSRDWTWISCIAGRFFTVWTTRENLSPDHLTTDYHFFKCLDNFLQAKCFRNQQEAENAFQDFCESQSMDFYAIGISTFISSWQKYVDCSDSYFGLIKMCLSLVIMI